MFYTGDWKKDPDLSKCSAATRGIWIDLLCAMHENGRTGIVTGSVVELAQMCRCSEREMNVALIELKASKTAHVTKSDKMSQRVSVKNRRMNREHKVREEARLRKRRQRGADMSHSMSRESHTPSSVSSSSSSSREVLVSKKLSREREGSGGTQASTLSDDFSPEYLDDLQDQKKFAHLDVRQVFEKFRDYYERRGMPLKRNKFIDWLNREIPTRKGNGANGDDDDRGTSAQARRVAASLERDN